MSSGTSLFRTHRPRRWNGRYSRIPGETSVFHLQHQHNRLWPAVIWDTEDGRATCFAHDGEPAASLAPAVENAKRMAGGSGGGSFAINEFGQVLVPASDGGGRRYLVGQLNGCLTFDNPFDEDDPIDMADVSSLYTGDPWQLPYVGMPFRLNPSRGIAFRQSSHDHSYDLYPTSQDPRLIQALAEVRGWNGGRFIVNYAGIVLTRLEQDGFWGPVYVGSIDLNRWFERENGDG